MSRSKRILGMVIPNENYNLQELPQKQRKVEPYESPVPECAEDLIQLHDLIGDVFDDHSKEKIIDADESEATIWADNNTKTLSIQCRFDETDQILLTKMDGQPPEINILKEITPVPSTCPPQQDLNDSCLPPLTLSAYQLQALTSNENNQKAIPSAGQPLVNSSDEQAPDLCHVQLDEFIDCSATPMPSPCQPHECSDGLCLCKDDAHEHNSVMANHEHEYSDLLTFSPVSAPSSVLSNVSGRKKSYKQDKGKKRLVHKENWSVVQRKLLKNKGKSFVNKSGHIVPEKQMKQPCKCRLKCSQHLSIEERLNIFEKFWMIGERRRQWEFVIKYTKKQPKRRQTTEVTKHDRQNTFIYYLPNVEKKPVRVCKTMFLNTISSGERIITTAWKKYDGDTIVDIDRRGLYEHSKRVIDENMVKSVCDHVKSFAPVPSHYIRQNSKKLYLEGVESLSRMYKLYCEWFDSTKYSKKADSKRQYRDIVNANFNLGLHKPKKDHCDVCHAFESKNDPTEEEKRKFEEHQTHKKVARDLKKADKAASKSNKCLVAATFDFEKVLVTPHGEVSVFYYKRRLPTYNFTVYNLGTKSAICYMWHEGIAKRGANEVSSCLYYFIKENAEKGVKEFRLWSDNCSGQNRNRIVFALYLLAAKQFKVTIIHRFMEKGHTQNEGDSVHSTIERASSRKLIYVPEEWYCLVRWAKSEGNPYLVKEMKTEEFYDFKALLLNKNWTKNSLNEKVLWTKVREVKVNADQFDKIEYRYDLSEENYKTICVMRTGTRNTQRISREFELKEAYSGALPITKDKYKDLNQLCQAGVIPERYHSFYKNLAHSSALRPTESDEDSE